MKMKKKLKKALACIFSLIIAFNMFHVPEASFAAKKKQPCLNVKKLTLKAGESQKIKIRFAPKKRKTIWHSSNKHIVMVNQNGRVTGISPGSAVIRVKLTYSVLCHSV